VFLVTLVSLVFVERHYAKLIKEKLAGHRWDLSSKLYAESYSLRPGMNLSLDRLSGILADLNYRRIESAPSIEGEYSLRKNAVDVYPRAFPVLGTERLPSPVRVTFSGNRLVDIRLMLDGASVHTLAIEPELITQYYSSAREAREVVGLNRIPKTLINAILAAEDQRFFQHAGFDLLAMIRALIADIFTSRLQGGSTITQQLVKNYFLTPERTVRRKVQELFMSWCLERHATKQEIMEMYVNEIYLGQRGTISINGFAQAARLYFRKSVSDLTLEESALLAGIIKAPNSYSPYRSPEKALERRNWVLDRMRTEGFISQEEATTAKQRPMRSEPVTREVNQAPYFADWVRVSLGTRFDDQTLLTRNLSIFTTLDPAMQEAAHQALRNTLDRLQRTYSKRFGKRRLEGCLIAVDPRSGAIRAMVGGRDYAQSQFNRAADAHRQLGSVVKPVVFAAALSSPNLDPPLTLATMLLDEPTTFLYKGKEWSPSDFEEPKGPVNVKRVLSESLNIPTAKVALETGLERVIQTARRMGFQTRIPPFPAISLGGFEVTPAEVAEAFSTIANGGVRVTLHGVKQIRDDTGKILWESEVKRQRAISPEVNYLLIDLMKGVVDSGTAAGVRSYGFSRPAAGKTGTTNDMRDCWFVGFTPQLLAAVWVGFDDNSPTGLTGSQAAVPVWAEFMIKALAGTPEEDFFIPQSIVFRAVDPINGYLATSNCDPIEILPFIEGTEPVEFCAQH